jgi:PIN domain nuclease of toxin-antitoxin system
MRVLLDTHTFLWFVWQDTRLSASAHALIVDPNNEPLLSPASYWEIAIKVGRNKLRLAEPYDVFMPREIRQNGFDILPIELAHTSVVATLPYYHRDPFDRLLIAQAMVEQIAIVSIDPAFDAYAVSRLW